MVQPKVRKKDETHPSDPALISQPETCHQSEHGIQFAETGGAVESIMDFGEKSAGQCAAKSISVTHVEKRHRMGVKS